MDYKKAKQDKKTDCCITTFDQSKIAKIKDQINNLKEIQVNLERQLNDLKNPLRDADPKKKADLENDLQEKETTIKQLKADLDKELIKKKPSFCKLIKTADEVKLIIKLDNPSSINIGLHARPSANISKAARMAAEKFQNEPQKFNIYLLPPNITNIDDKINIEGEDIPNKKADGFSILSILGLGVKRNSIIALVAKGSAASTIIEEVEKVLKIEELV